MNNVTMNGPEQALKILKGEWDGDEYLAADALAQYMGMVGCDPDGLTDWLAEGDYSGNETISDLVEEWREFSATPKPPKPTIELSIPRSATIDAASYWMKRAAALCPGSDVVPKFV